MLDRREEKRPKMQLDLVTMLSFTLGIAVAIATLYTHPSVTHALFGEPRFVFCTSPSEVPAGLLDPNDLTTVLTGQR